MTSSGSFDKAVLEAMACGIMVLVASRAFENALPDISLVTNGMAGEVAKKLETLLKLTSKDVALMTEQGRAYIVGHHNVKSLAKKIVEIYESL